jgi:ribonuclease HI
MLDFKSVEFYHIPREKNKLADKLVNVALDQETKQDKLI